MKNYIHIYVFMSVLYLKASSGKEIVATQHGYKIKHRAVILCNLKILGWVGDRS